MNFKNIFKVTAVVMIACGVVKAADETPKHEGSHPKHEGSHLKSKGAGGRNVSGRVTGEILDLLCYVDHNAKGDAHAGAAKRCIERGLPVGIKSNDDGKVYIIVGEHKPLNKKLASHAGKTVTLKGKLISHDGVNMIANATIEQ